MMLLGCSQASGFPKIFQITTCRLLKLFQVVSAQEYTDPDPTGLRTMILCRCTMGRAIRQEGGGRECMKAGRV